MPGNDGFDLSVFTSLRPAAPIAPFANAARASFSAAARSAEVGHRLDRTTINKVITALKKLAVSVTPFLRLAETPRGTTVPEQEEMHAISNRQVVDKAPARELGHSLPASLGEVCRAHKDIRRSILVARGRIESIWSRPVSSHQVLPEAPLCCTGISMASCAPPSGVRRPTQQNQCTAAAIR
jgi:hypothetical protein